MDEHVIETLQNMIAKGDVVFFGGAGVSTASGIPDFRSAGGVYGMETPYPPEKMLSHSFFRDHPDLFFDFYRNNLLYLDAAPNMAHTRLAGLEKTGKVNGVITQNVDGLHQAAGSELVMELHGSVHRNYCLDCGKTYDARFVQGSEGIPTCGCGGVVRPDVVLYEEGLDDRVVNNAVQAVRRARTLMIGGTSLVVYPAAGFVNYFQGENLVIINQSPTSQDSQANLVIRDGIAEVFQAIAAG